MGSRKNRVARRRGRPALVHPDAPTSLVSTHASPSLKLALVEEAHAANCSLSLYVAVALATVEPGARLAAVRAELERLDRVIERSEEVATA